MTDNPPHHRRSIRLQAYDYAQPGAYFLTICAYGHTCLFGEVVGAEMVLNEFGAILQEEWRKSAAVRAEIELGEFIIMPNHFHAIVHILENEKDLCSQRGNKASAAAAQNGPAKRSIGALVAGFKSAAARRINEKRATPGAPVWQRNYWEHIIRDEKSYTAIAAYIASNPIQWQQDTLHP